MHQLLKYNNNCGFLKEFIVSNYDDKELIDYDEEHYMDDRNNTKFTGKELDREFAEHSQKYWQFMAEKVIFRDPKYKLNQHQMFI